MVGHCWGWIYRPLMFARRLAELNPNEKIILLRSKRRLAKVLLEEIQVMQWPTATFLEATKRSQLKHYQRIDRINQTGLNSLKSIIDKNQIEL